MKNIQRTLFALAAAACLSAGAQAATLYTSTTPTGDLLTPGSVPVSFNAGAGAGTISFQLQGYNSLDGDNFYIDIFTLSVNNVSVFSGTWDLGGGGADRILSGSAGATAVRAGQMVDLSIPVSFLAGSNNVSFSYASPTTFEGSGRAGPQGLGDEGWGVNSITVTGNTVTAAVPEPETYALMLAGLGALGFLARRKSAAR